MIIRTVLLNQKPATIARELSLPVAQVTLAKIRALKRLREDAGEHRGRLRHHLPRADGLNHRARPQRCALWLPLIQKDDHGDQGNGDQQRERCRKAEQDDFA